jgi:hypothetical protein
MGSDGGEGPPEIAGIAVIADIAEIGTAKPLAAD